MKSHPLRLAQITCDFGSRKPKKWGAIPKSASPFVPQLFGTSRLQIFDSTGQHLYTRNDLGLQPNCEDGIAWSKGGQLALARGDARTVLVWR